MVKLLVMVLLCSFHLYAQDVKNGEKLFGKCAACHGTDGMGKKSQNAPMLAGQHDWYIKTQINNIKNQVRTNGNVKKMYPFVKNLSDGEISDLAAYISQLAKKR